MEQVKIMPVGDQALLVEFGKTIDEEINKQVLGLTNYLRINNIVGIKELLPTYRSLMIFYDNTQTSYWKLRRKITKIKNFNSTEATSQARKIMVPCCYEEAYGPDLVDMEEHLKLGREEIIKLHSENSYKIYMLGFLPGFVYLGGLNEKIHMPRLATPRTVIPERSVGIGGNQTGVYPMASPGGWRLIGRTPIDFYNPEKEEPILCKAGDYIQFVPITSNEYELIRNDVKHGNYKVEIQKL